MALVACKECGKEVSSTATQCPHCGKALVLRGPGKWMIVGLLGFAAYLLFSHVGDTVSQHSTAASAATRRDACEPQQFVLDDLRGRIEYDYLIVTARLTNSCQIAAGVQLETSVYNAQGSLIDTDTGWPASIRNIPAGGSENIKIMVRPPETRKINFKVRPIATKVWNR
jgi:hypothetical protein